MLRFVSNRWNICIRATSEAATNCSCQPLVYGHDGMMRVATVSACAELDGAINIGITNTVILNERVVRVVDAPVGARMGFGPRPRRREPNIPSSGANTTARSASR
jgi:hypothetical protein